ncbi:MAG: septum site-determining protein MinC [Candidatus Accumulibacter phosphatis]|jgi:septum site-determining protein MinC|uniref:Probable septum site-determining protein MinC n=1 Tax=Candidatus Accumulibacter contiguus TaxID=2954381 RepID=A0ABX1T7G4_9PROT|nr:septum site-determining protein MinC [Candidatus Accumulibacter contiguus]MBL8409544.1 septum site-determining protein MinC [Accumulibacter sp.]NMQ05039.1 septum site-determining protein MinC [Candidatus Accumulibacter contiguus]
MQRTNKTIQLIEFKGTTLPVVVVTLRTLQPEALAEAASRLFGDDDFFDGDAALLELAQLADVPEADWRRVKQVLKAHGLNVIGVRGGSEELRYSAAFAGLPTYAAGERAIPVHDNTAAPPPPVTEPAPKAPPPTPAAASAPALFIDRPLRSGQQVYARGGDLVVLAAVNAGAEVIADGHIHIYAPLHGRALAGASGAAGARIFCTRFDAELVSVAGLYRTFDGGVPVELAEKPVQIRRSQKPGEEASTLIVEALRID